VTLPLPLVVVVVVVVAVVAVVVDDVLGLERGQGRIELVVVRRIALMAGHATGSLAGGSDGATVAAGEGVAPRLHLQPEARSFLAPVHRTHSIPIEVIERLRCLREEQTVHAMEGVGSRVHFAKSQVSPGQQGNILHHLLDLILDPWVRGRIVAPERRGEGQQKRATHSPRRLNICLGDLVSKEDDRSEKRLCQHLRAGQSEGRRAVTTYQLQCKGLIRFIFGLQLGGELLQQ
jgi:hypothetical protein